MPAESPNVFSGQGLKLRYLIKDRGDQRERSRANPTLVRDAADGGHPRDVRSSMVHNQADLAAFLGVTPPEVSRWCLDRARFPDRLLGELCRLYAIDEHHFRRLSHASFVATYGDPETVGRKATPALSTIWRMLLGAASGHAEVLPTEPADDTSDGMRPDGLRYATARRPETAEPLPVVIQSEPFWIRLLSPQRPDAGLIWAGWHVTLLNHDVGRDGFRALLPRETNDAAQWRSRMPAGGRMTLPRVPILRHDAPDLGPFAIVAVLTQDPLPAQLADELGREQAQGLALEPVLDELAAHLAMAMQASRAGLAVARYQVV